MKGRCIAFKILDGVRISMLGCSSIILNIFLANKGGKKVRSRTNNLGSKWDYMERFCSRSVSGVEANNHSCCFFHASYRIPRSGRSAPLPMLPFQSEFIQVEKKNEVIQNAKRHSQTIFKLPSMFCSREMNIRKLPVICMWDNFVDMSLL